MFLIIPYRLKRKHTEKTVFRPFLFAKRPVVFEKQTVHFQRKLFGMVISAGIFFPFVQMKEKCSTFLVSYRYFSCCFSQYKRRKRGIIPIREEMTEKEKQSVKMPTHENVMKMGSSILVQNKRFSHVGIIILTDC